MSDIRFQNVWKFFEGNPVVSDLNLDIRSGEFLVLVGPSGCGKTTSLRMLAGLERPSHGRIFFGDQDITDLASGQRDVSMVFQSYALWPNMSVRKNLSFGPRMRHEDKSTLDDRVNRVADMLSIRPYLDRSPSALSGGQRQRVALGRALIREPKVFLMDEPLSNLDAALRVQMRAELIRLHSRLEDTTTVYVTHDQVEALTMGDRVAVLKDGVLLQVDSPNDLYENPVNVFVAEFIGSPKMSVVPGHLALRGDGATLTVLGVASEVDPAIVSRLSSDCVSGPVLVGIRPHDLHPAGEGRNESETISGVVDICEHTGTEMFASVEVAEGKVMARLPRNAAVAQGDRIDLAYGRDRVYLFDPTTQQSLLGRTTGRAVAYNGRQESVSQ